MWPPGRPRINVDDGYYEEEEDAEPEPPRHRQRVKRRVNPFIDAETGVVCHASAAEGTDDEIDDLDGFIVTDDDKF